MVRNKGADCMFYYTYILRSKRDDRLYIGHTRNINKRLYEHNSGQVISTKSRCPLTLIFYEAYLSEKDSIRREKYFKSTKGKRTIKLMLKDYLSNM